MDPVSITPEVRSFLSEHFGEERIAERLASRPGMPRKFVEIALDPDNLTAATGASGMTLPKITNALVNAGIFCRFSGKAESGYGPGFPAVLLIDATELRHNLERVRREIEQIKPDTPGVAVRPAVPSPDHGEAYSMTPHDRNGRLADSSQQAGGVAGVPERLYLGHPYAEREESSGETGNAPSLHDARHAARQNAARRFLNETFHFSWIGSETLETSGRPPAFVVHLKKGQLPDYSGMDLAGVREALEEVGIAHHIHTIRQDVNGMILPGRQALLIDARQLGDHLVEFRRRLGSGREAKPASDMAAIGRFAGEAGTPRPSIDTPTAQVISLDFGKRGPRRG